MGNSPWSQGLGHTKMYLSHYSLKIKPFQISTDPRFLWLGENHKEALAILKYGIMDNRGFLLLTGDVGTGKTTLINALTNSLGEEVVAAFVPDPTLEKIDFFNYISNAFGIKKKYASKGEFISVFKKFLNREYSNSKKVLLIIDESHRLTHELLEEIRLLSNIERQNTKLINIFFVGQSEFNNLLWEKRNRALKQRLTINHNISPLTKTETGAYIKHRLKIAGTEKPIFTPTAINEIHGFANGLPRMINIVCDHAMLTGYVKGVTRISVKIVRECIKDLHIPRTLRSSDDRDSDYRVPQGRGTGREPLKKNRLTDRKEKKLGPLAWTAAFLGLFILVFLSVGYLQYSGTLDDSIQKISRIWHHVKAEWRPYADERPSVPEGRSEISPSPEPSMEGRENAERNQNSTGFSDEAGITETDLAPEGDGEDDLFRGATEEDTRAPGNTVDAVRRESGLPQADTMGKFKKLYRVLTLLEQRVTITFPRDSNEISAEAVDVLSEIAEVLIYYPGIYIRIVGYTDSSGVYSYNKSLSQFRANIVKSYLVGRGVKREQIAAVGMGAENPVGENDTRLGRKINRRVEIVLNGGNSFSTPSRPRAGGQSD